MILAPSNGPGIQLLTPMGALKYLLRKPKYLVIWNNLIRYFDAKEFCDLINEIRVKRIEAEGKLKQKIALIEQNPSPLTPQEKFKLKTLKKQKEDLFFDLTKETFGNLISKRIKNTDISLRQVNQLIGSLAHIGKTPKEQIQEVTEGVNKGLQKELSRMEAYEDEFFTIFTDISKQYLESNIGASISNDEKRQFSDQARSVFLQRHKEDIEKKKIDTQKINAHLHSKKLIY